MANTLGNYNVPLFANEALIWLMKALGMANRVHLGYDEERKRHGLGDVINIRRPAQFTAQSAPSSSQGVATESVAITLNNWNEVKFDLPDDEHAYVGDRFIREHIGPAAYALADKIDQDLVSLYTDIPHSVDASSPLTVANLTATRQKLFDNKAPLQMESFNHFMIGGVEEAELLNLEAFSQFQGAGNVGTESQLRGQIGMRFGMNFFANQNRPTHTAGSITAADPEVQGAHAAGATSVIVDDTTLTGTVKAGDLVTFEGDSLPYSITADATAASNAITLTISPPLRVAIADDADVTFDQDATNTKVNLAFHRNAFALAFAQLPDFDEFTTRLGTEVFSVQDPVTGIALRARVGYDFNNSKMMVALDTLYGFKTLDTNLAVRLLNA